MFSRKPLFGYPFVVFSGVAIGFMGWGVWAHHMFASGLGPISVSAFSLSTMFIAVPTGVKILNWIATMWGGKLRFTTAMKFAIGLVSMFTIGGLSGVTHAVAPSDTQQTDTYYIVAHFHYVLFGGAVFGFFAGFYYWWPKVFGRMLSERLGSLNFWLMLIGFNLTFGPMHVLGLQGQPRRMYIYDSDMGFDIWNMVSTVGRLHPRGRRAGVPHQRVPQPQGPGGPPRPVGRPQPGVDDVQPARGRTTSTPSPRCTASTSSSTGSTRRTSTASCARCAPRRQIMAEAPPRDAHIHMPSPSYWPLVAAAGLPFIIGRADLQLWISFFGLLVLVLAIYGWALEPATAPDGRGRRRARRPREGGRPRWLT